MDKFVENIFDILIKILPSDWGKIVLRVVLGRGRQSISFFVKDQVSNEYYSFVKLQEMGIFSKYEFQNSSIQIEKVSREYQKTFEKVWTGYTLVILRDGRNYTDFEYEQNVNVLSSEWLKKYLD